MQKQRIEPNAFGRARFDQGIRFSRPSCPPSLPLHTQFRWPMEARVGGTTSFTDTNLIAHRRQLLLCLPLNLLSTARPRALAADKEPDITTLMC